VKLLIGPPQPRTMKLTFKSFLAPSIVEERAAGTDWCQTREELLADAKTVNGDDIAGFTEEQKNAFSGCYAESKKSPRRRTPVVLGYATMKHRPGGRNNYSSPSSFVCLRRNPPHSPPYLPPPFYCPQHNAYSLLYFFKALNPCLFPAPYLLNSPCHQTRSSLPQKPLRSTTRDF
jgi:hypothetical protein